MDSLDWSRKFEVLGISRLYLNSIGFTFEQIKSLSDEDMQAIADSLNSYFYVGYDRMVRFVAACFFIQREWEKKLGGNHGPVA